MCISQYKILIIIIKKTSLDGMKLEDLVLIVLTDGKSNKSSCCVGRPTDEKDPIIQGSSKFGRQLEEELLERKSSGNDNARELGIPGSNE